MNRLLQAFLIIGALAFLGLHGSCSPSSSPAAPAPVTIFQLVTATNTPTGSATPTFTITLSPTSTWTPVTILTTPTFTPTGSATPTYTVTLSPTPTFTPVTIIVTPTWTATPTPTSTLTVTPTGTPTASFTPTSTQQVTHFLVTGPAAVTAGAPFNFTVTAEDASNSIVTTYNGIVHFTSADPQGGLPADSTLVNGTKTFTNGANLKTAGSQSLTATDTLTFYTGALSGITVAPAGAVSLVVTTNATNPQTHGTSFSVTVTAKDPYGNVATGYTGTIHFTSTDPGSPSLPGDFTFSSGTQVFTGVILNTLGLQTITATDNVTFSITGTSSGININ